MYDTPKSDFLTHGAGILFHIVELVAATGNILESSLVARLA